MSKVLVVGSAGFVGSRLMRDQKFTKCDLKTGQDIRKGMKGKYDIVVFLAADLDQGRESYSNNLELFSALVKYFKDERIIYTSSAAIYGDRVKPVDEQDFTAPDTLYGKIKLLGEDIIQDAFENYMILRLSNVVGNGDGHGVCDIFQNGGNVIYGNGEQVRDYVHVDKVVNAILAIIENLDRYNRGIFNISSGKGQSVNEVFDFYGDGNPVYKEEREFDIGYSVLDNSLAKEVGLL